MRDQQHQLGWIKGELTAILEKTATLMAAVEGLRTEDGKMASQYLCKRCGQVFTTSKGLGSHGRIHRKRTKA